MLLELIDQKILDSKKITRKKLILSTSCRLQTNLKFMRNIQLFNNNKKWTTVFYLQVQVLISKLIFLSFRLKHFVEWCVLGKHCLLDCFLPAQGLWLSDNAPTYPHHVSSNPTAYTVHRMCGSYRDHMLG